ncbi:MAG TPA: hypothetical protein VIQ75_02810 [Gammaproteobacteria bacterium]
MHRFTLTFLVLCLAGSVPGQASEAFMAERWTLEAFTDALGGGPATGPVALARGRVDTLCGDAAGNRFLAGDQFIDIVTPAGQRRHLAGSGEPGFRNGPAHQAAFRMGIGSYYSLYDLACTADGDLFVADSGNARVRRVFRGDDGWRVETWAGGGKTRLGPGMDARPAEVELPATMALAALPDGTLLIATSQGYLSVDPDGRRIRHGARWPDSLALPGKGYVHLNPVAGDADRSGQAYFLSRGPDVVVAVAPSGETRHLAGIVRARPPKPHHIGDGPPREVFLDATMSLAADPAGRAVYVCGGDEYDIRRIPTDGETHTATLMQNGRWYRASVHPNRSRGGAVFRPGRDGRLDPDGKLDILLVAPLAGRDYDGVLYGRLNHWSGMSQYVEGRGLLPTRVFRIRPERP